MKIEEEQTYLDFADRIIRDGSVKRDRTGVGTNALFATQQRFDLRCNAIPIVSSRKIKPLDPIIEMIWFIAGGTDISFLKKYKINIWDSWVQEETKVLDEEGQLVGGSIGSGAYGAQ